MRLGTAVLAAMSLGLAATSADSLAQGTRPAPTAVWAPKPADLPGYSAPQRPWKKLAEIRAAHRGAAAWREVVVDDGRLTAEYVQDPPGAKAGQRFHPDTREWFAVVEGRIRVEIEGQPAFTAMRGSLVNIPRQTLYALETVGDAASLRFVVNVAGAKTFYLHETAPPAAPAWSRWIAATINRTPGRYDEFNRPHLNIHEAAAGDAKYSGGRFVRDDKSEMLVLYGHEKNLPPLDPKDKGHFHAESAEFWLVFAGQIRYAFEGQAPFVASEGAVACGRLSITEYVGNALIREPGE